MVIVPSVQRRCFELVGCDARALKIINYHDCIIMRLLCCNDDKNKFIMLVFPRCRPPRAFLTDSTPPRVCPGATLIIITIAVVLVAVVVVLLLIAYCLLLIAYYLLLIYFVGCCL